MVCGMINDGKGDASYVLECVVIGAAYCMIYCLVTLLQYPFSILNILKFEFPSLFPKLESNQYEKLK